jgi:hypothetical protein
VPCEELSLPFGLADPGRRLNSGKTVSPFCQGGVKVMSPFCNVASLQLRGISDARVSGA